MRLAGAVITAAEAKARVLQELDKTRANGAEGLRLHQLAHAIPEIRPVHLAGILGDMRAAGELAVVDVNEAALRYRRP